jgi:hypothetical protein
MAKYFTMLVHRKRQAEKILLILVHVGKQPKEGTGSQIREMSKPNEQQEIAKGFL